MGGLGFQNLGKMNDACIMKIGWSLKRGESSLYDQFLVGKHGCMNLVNGDIVACNTNSSLWKAIVST